MIAQALQIASAAKGLLGGGGKQDLGLAGEPWYAQGGPSPAGVPGVDLNRYQSDPVYHIAATDFLNEHWARYGVNPNPEHSGVGGKSAAQSVADEIAARFSSASEKFATMQKQAGMASVNPLEQFAGQPGELSATAREYFSAQSNDTRNAMKYAVGFVVIAVLALFFLRRT